MYPRQLRHQRRKFLRIHPELELSGRKNLPKGRETNRITAVESEVSGNRVVKRFDARSQDDDNWQTTPHSLKARFKFQKELYSRGFPVPRPIRLTLKSRGGGFYDVTWEEELIRGPDLQQVFNRIAEEGHAKGRSREELEKERARILGEATNQLEGLTDYLYKRGTHFMDFVPNNIVMDEKTGKFYLIDIGDYPRTRKPPKTRR